MATIQYARLYPDTTQLQAKDGHNLTAGWVEVYLAGTDDPAITYADFNGTRNPQRIVVDDNGRFCAIVDKSKAYRVEVYDADGMLQWTTEPVWCTGNAGAGMSVTRVVSTDGSIAVEESIDGSERTYDLSIAPSDSDEFLEWIKCSEEDCGSTWHPVYQAGTMETEAGQGIKVHAGQLYHFTNTFYVDPDGTGINYDTFKVMMYCNDEIVDVRDFDIDSSLNDSVMCEFSTDLIPEADGVVYYKLTIPSTCEVTAEVQCHRIYSGINAVPDTCATKQWVEETFDYNMAEKISYSALEYNGNGDISGISGSAIAGGLDSAAVSSIASSYAESAISSISGWSGDFSSISSKIDWSSSGVFQPSGNYQTAGDYAYNSSLSSKADQSAFEQCCDEVHSALDEKLDKSASSEFQPSGQYVYESSYSSFSSEVTNNISSLSSNVSGISADMSAYVPFSGLEGEGGKVTGISGSAFKGHEYTGIYPVIVDNVEDTISVEHRTLCVDSTMTAYNSGSSAVIGVNTAGLDLSSKMDASASSLFYPTSNPSGFLTAHQSLAGYATEAYVDSSVSSKLDTTAFSTVSGDFLTSHQSLAGYATESYVDSAVSGKLDVTASSQFLTSLPDDLAYTSDVASAVSGKMDKSESSSFYPMDGNPSGYLTAHQSLAGYATETYVDSAVSGKLDATAYDSAEFYTTSNPSGFVDSAYVESQVSGKQNSGDYLTAKVGSGQATFYTALQDGMDKRPALVISAQRSAGSSMYPRMLVTDWNNTTGETHSGALLANAFEFYSCPDSARGEVDPSGIVQSRLDASHLRFNVDPAISAYTKSSEFTRYGMRLGSAGTSASWAIVSGDGPNGGFIILDDGSGTSGRIVASSIGYWNDKLDGSASSSYYTTANESGYVDSAYVESQISGKQDSLTFDWDSNSAISSINGSALAGQGGGGGSPIVVTGTAWDSSTSAYVYDLSSNLSAAESHVYSSQMDGQLNYIDKFFDDSSNAYRLEAALIRAGAEQCAPGWSSRFVYMPGRSMWTTADDATGLFAPLQYATGACLAMSAGNYFKAYYKGNEWFVADNRYGYARGEVHNSRGCRVIVEHTAGSWAALSAKNSDANVTLNNGKFYGTAKMAVANSQAYVQVQRGDSAYKYNSAKLDTDYLKFYNSMTTGYLDPEDTASGTSYLPAETEYMYISSIPYWNAKMDSAEMSAYVAKSAYDELYSSYTALSGVISTYSGWFSELSSISAKVDNSAIGVIE